MLKYSRPNKRASLRFSPVLYKLWKTHVLAYFRNLISLERIWKNCNKSTGVLIAHISQVILRVPLRLLLLLSMHCLSPSVHLDSEEGPRLSVPDFLGGGSNKITWITPFKVIKVSECQRLGPSLTARRVALDIIISL